MCYAPCPQTVTPRDELLEVTGGVSRPRKDAKAVKFPRSEVGMEHRQILIFAVLTVVLAMLWWTWDTKWKHWTLIRHSFTVLGNREVEYGSLSREDRHESWRCAPPADACH